MFHPGTHSLVHCLGSVVEEVGGWGLGKDCLTRGISLIGWNLKTSLDMKIEILIII